MRTKPILYIEDDENDVFFLQRAFKLAGIPNPLQVVGDGQRAIEYLAGAGPFADRQEFPVPCLILLDLNLPLKSGHEVLAWLRHEAPFSTMPVVVLTSSNQDSDIHKAYALGANAYLLKPPGPDQLLQLAKLLKDFWLVQNVPPPECQDLTLAAPAATRGSG